MRSLTLATGLLAVCLSADPCGATEQDTAADPNEVHKLHRLHYGVHLPSERDQVRSIRLAQEAVSKEAPLQGARLLLKVFAQAEDAWIDGPQPTSVRRQALELLDKLPLPARRAYALEANPPAQRLLDRALENPSAGSLWEVVRLYPGTPAAREARALLAMQAWDNAHLQTAATLLKDQPGVVARRRLEHCTAASNTEPQPTPGERTPELGFGLGPESEVLWVAVAGATRGRNERIGLDSSLGSDGSPVAVLVADQTLLWRTPSNAVALDLATGRRWWETTPPLVDVPSESSSGRGTPVIESQPALGLTTDRRRVILPEGIRGSSEATGGEQLWAAARDRPWRPAPHQLVAHSLTGEHDKLWSSRPGQPKAGQSPATYLGAPLTYEGRLFALTDADQTVSLVELDQQTGETLWRQRLLGVDRAPIAGVADRVTPAAPVVAEGIACCPTRGGTLLAYDLVNRTLLWAFRMTVEPSFAVGRPREGGAHWRECRAEVLGDAVLVCSPESPRLFCIDLHNGTMRWSQRRMAGLYFAAAHQDVYLVTPNFVESIDFQTGRVRWKTAIKAEGDVAGAPLACRDGLMLATTRGDVLGFDAEKGEPIRLARGLGVGAAALTAIDRGLLYATAQQLTLFGRGDGAEGTGVGPLLRKAQLLEAEGETQQALATLRQAVRAFPTSAAATRSYVRRLQLLSDQVEPLDSELLESQRARWPRDPEIAFAQACLALREQIALGGAAEGNERLLRAARDVAEGVIPEGRLVELGEGWFAALGDALQVRLSSYQQKTPTTEPAQRARSAAAGGTSRTDWGARQVDVRLVPADSSEALGDNSGLEMSQLVTLEATVVGEPSPSAPVSFAATNDGTALLGYDPSGAVCVWLNLSDSSNERVGSTRVGRGARLWLVGELLVIESSGAVGVIDLSAKRARDPNVWSAIEMIQQAFARSGQVDGPPQGWRVEINRPVSVAAVSTDRVVVSASGTLFGLELKSGALRWSLAHRALGAQSRSWPIRLFESTPPTFTAGDHLWVQHGRKEMVHISMADGSLLGSAEHRHLPEASWRHAPGRLLETVATDANGAKRLVLRDSMSFQELRECGLSPGTVVLRASDAHLAIVSPEGWFQSLDAQTGALGPEVRWSDAPVPAVRARILGGRLIVLANQKRTDGPPQEDSLDSAPLTTGKVYALDPRSGEPLWSSPAEIESLGLLERQSGDHVLTFAARQITADGRRLMRVLLLDAATGVELHRQELTRATGQDAYHLYYDGGWDEPELVLELPGQVLRARSIAAPRPPEPPPGLAVDSGEGADLWRLGSDLQRAWSQAVQPQQAGKKADDD